MIGAGSRFQTLEERTDTITANYAWHIPLDKSSISYSRLQNRLKRSQVNINDFESEELVQVEGESVKILAPEERVSVIDQEQNIKTIDRFHKLQYAYEQNDYLLEINHWYSEGVRWLIDFLEYKYSSRDFNDLLRWAKNVSNHVEGDRSSGAQLTFQLWSNSS